MECVRFFSIILLFPAVVHWAAAAEHYTRADFPPGFVFGSGLSASQYEGAAFEDGRTPSIWDTFAHSGGTGEANGDVACDGYHKYKEDIRLMKDTGLEAFRFSISWSRLIPNGRGPINPKGLQYYNNVINELINHGIQPHITLNHIDLPQALEDDYEGWLSKKIVKDFVEYTDVCFREFGDRVLHWTTLNQINVAAIGGYVDNVFAPGRCSTRTKCAKGNSSIEPYIAAHNMLLAHSAAANLYKEKYQATQKGFVGVNVYSFGMVPYSNSTEDVMASQRAHAFYIGWILGPLIFGDYPDIMKKRVETRLPSFTRDEVERLKGSFDFIGINYYVTVFIKDNATSSQTEIRDFYTDMSIDVRYERDDTPAEDYQMSWGIEETLDHIKQVYGNPPIYIHENGKGNVRNGTLNDTSRIEYLEAYIGSVLNALRNGSNTKGYFTWSFLDCYELLSGWMSGNGFYYVDLDDEELRRYPKLSAHWYSDFLREKAIGPNAYSS